MRSLLFLALLGGCGKPALTCPAKGGHQWRELTTTHFVLRTDLSGDDARREITDLEHQYAALLRFGFPTVTDRPRRAMVIALRDPDAYRLLGSDHAKRRDGWIRHRSVNAEWGITVVYPERLPPGGNVEINELLARRLIAQRAPVAPPWVYLGLPEVYARIVIEDGHATLGQPRTFIDFNTRERARLATGMRFPGSDVVRPHELRRLDFDDFCHDHVPGADHKPVNRPMGLMFGSWLTGRALRFGETASAFESYLDAFRADDADPADAWKRTLSPGEGAIGKRFEELVAAPMTLSVRVAFDLAAVSVEERSLPSAAVHVTWALAHGMRDLELYADARHHAEEAVAEEPSSPEARFALGVVSLTADKRLKHLREALDRAPNDAHYLHVLAREHFSEQLKLPESNRSWADVEPLATLLSPVATSALQLEFLASYRLERGRLEEAATFAKRAVEIDPGCVPCRETASRVHERRGDLAAAIREQHVAAGLSITDLPECARTTNRFSILQARARIQP